MLLSKCAICDTTKSRFIKKQEANGFLSSLGIKTLLSKIPLLGNVLFEYNFIEWFNSYYKNSIKWMK